MNNYNKPWLKTIRLAYSILIVGLIVFIGTAVVLVEKNGTLGHVDEYAGTVLLSSSSMVALLAISAAICITRKRLNKIEYLPPSKKMHLFQSTMFVRALTKESCSVFFIFCYILTGTNLSLILAIGILGLLIYYFPTNERMTEELKHDLREI